MYPSTPAHNQPRRTSGQVSIGWLALIVLLAVAIAALVYLALNRSGSATPTTPPTQAQLDEQLAALQNDLQTALQEKQDLTRLAAQARAFTEAHPKQQGGHILHAQARMGLNQWDQAYAAWDKALATGDSGFELCKMAGLCAAKLGRVEQALTHYQQAVAATNDQADSEVYAAIGRLQLALNNPDAAEQMYNRAVDARGPGEDTNYKHEAYAGLADVATVRGDFEKALSWIDRAIKMANLDGKGDTAGYHIQKARIYLDANRDADATTMLSYTWNLYPESLWRIESARLRARLFERAGELGKAVDHLQSVTEWHRLAEQRRDDVLADFTAVLADWQIKAKRLDDARISLHNLQALMPGHPAIAQLQAKLP